MKSRNTSLLHFVSVVREQTLTIMRVDSSIVQNRVLSCTPFSSIFQERSLLPQIACVCYFRSRTGSSLLRGDCSPCNICDNITQDYTLPTVKEDLFFPGPTQGKEHATWLLMTVLWTSTKPNRMNSWFPCVVSWMQCYLRSLQVLCVRPVFSSSPRLLQHVIHLIIYEGSNEALECCLDSSTLDLLTQSSRRQHTSNHRDWW